MSPPAKGNSNSNTAAATPTNAITKGKIKSSTYKWPSFTVILDDLEKKKKFQSQPGLYAVLIGTKVGDTKESILSFAYSDCSIFSVESGTVTSRSQSISGILFELNVSVGKPFIDKEEAALLEPLFINIER